MSEITRAYAIYKSQQYNASYDPETQQFTFCGPVSGQINMGMTEDDRGVIWCASWPGGELCSFDPESRKLTDYGKLVDPGWPIYQRYIEADDAGWIYFGIGNTEAQIYAFHPESRTVKAIVPPEEMIATATGEVHRAANGKVYGWLRTRTPKAYYELHAGKAVRMENLPEVAWQEKALARGHQFLFDREFAECAGFSSRWMNGLLSILTVVTIMLGLQTAGVILMSALLIAPAAAARQWTNHFGKMLVLSAAFGGISGFAGTAVSSAVPLVPTGPAIVTAVSLIAGISLLFAPKRGILARLSARRRTAKKLEKGRVFHVSSN